MAAGESVYGGNVVGKDLTGGVDLDEDHTQGGPGGFYDLGNRLHFTQLVLLSQLATTPSPHGGLVIQTVQVATKLVSALTDAEKKLIRFDPDILANPSDTVVVLDTDFAKMTINLNEDAPAAVDLGSGTNHPHY